MDDVSMVFLRNTPRNRSWIDRLQIDCRTQPLTPPSPASRPALYDFYLNSGALFFELHRDQESEQSLRRASSMYAEDPNAHLLLASLFQRQQRYSEAEQEYRASIARSRNSGALYSLGCLYAYEGRNAEALQAIESAAEQSVEPLDMYMTLGKLQLALNHPQESLAAFTKAEKSSPFRNGGESLAPELYAEIAGGRAEAHGLLGHRSKAIAFQQESTRWTPLNAQRWLRLAQLCALNGETQLASQAQERANELQNFNGSR
jgi:tetratricopeptide (TPR) repeat protein